MISNSITKLQTALRCWLLRKRFLKNRAAAVTVQAWVRGERTRATVGREMAELVRKRKEKEAMELEAARLAEVERLKQLEEQALSVRLGQVYVCVVVRAGRGGAHVLRAVDVGPWTSTYFCSFGVNLFRVGVSMSPPASERPNE